MLPEELEKSIFPQGVPFGCSAAHVAIRRELIERQRLMAVISMPQQVFVSEVIDYVRANGEITVGMLNTGSPFNDYDFRGLFGDRLGEFRKLKDRINEMPPAEAVQGDAFQSEQTMRHDMTKEEVENYLTKIRKTIAESEAAISQAELRIAETDRLLEKEGLAREQVLAMKPTREQLVAVNEELERRGLGKLDFDDEEFDAYPELGRKAEPNPSAEFVSNDEELENRKRKFTTMMQSYRL